MSVQNLNIIIQSGIYDLHICICKSPPIIFRSVIIFRQWQISATSADHSISDIRTIYFLSLLIGYIGQAVQLEVAGSFVVSPVVCAGFIPKINE